MSIKKRLSLPVLLCALSTAHLGAVTGFDAEPLPDDDSDLACCQPSDINNLCYIGSLDIKGTNKRSEQLDLGYDGTLVPVTDGIYCFKEHKDVQKFYLLFIDPVADKDNDAIQFVNKPNADNTISTLSFVAGIPYHFYRLKRIATGNEAAWDIKRKPMAKLAFNGQLVVPIPDHTLIIPLPSNFFKKTKQGSILFTYKALKGDSVVKFPTPVVAVHNKEELQEALLKAHVCMIHLKNIHTKQEAREVNLDKHRLVQ